MNETLPLYPTIGIERNSESVTLHGQNKITICEANDLFLKNNSLFIALKSIPDKSIAFQHPLYVYCNALIYGLYEDIYCVYDPQEKRWLAASEELNEWTNYRYDRRILYFQDSSIAEEVLPYPYCEIQIRKKLKL